MIREELLSYKVKTVILFLSDPKQMQMKFVDIMRKKYGILIKSYDGIGRFGKCLRVTTAEKKYMEKFVTALLEIEKSIN